MGRGLPPAGGHFELVLVSTILSDDGVRQTGRYNHKCPAASPGHVALPMNIMSTGDPALTVTCPVRQGIHFSENYFVAAATLFWSLST